MLLMAIKIRNIITNTGKMNQMRTEKKPHDETKIERKMDKG